MQHVRLGIAGLGNIGKFHAGYLLDKKISRCEMTVVSLTFSLHSKPLLSAEAAQQRGPAK